ncbi:MAG: hypothetical protein LAO56_10755 [Acidobacteriia bacterium]|nr:hypothetical protein [Terriglobia bacterium]
MVPRNDLQSRLASLSVTLRPQAPQENEELIELEKLLVRSRIDDPNTAVTPRSLAIDRATFNAPENLGQDRRQRIGRLLKQLKPDQAPEFLVFRREAPVAAPMLELASPVWGRGALAQHSLGPFHSVDGRLYWFDFFQIVRMVPVYLPGDSQPALLFYEKTFIAAPPPVGKQHKLGKSSFWIRADLLATAAPAGGYVGLRIKAGTLSFSAPPTDVGGKLTMPLGCKCEVDLQLSPSQQPGAAPGNAGTDASNATLTTPDEFVFELQASQITVRKLTDAQWKLYDKTLGFSWIAASAPTYEPSLLSMVIPLRVSKNAFEVGTSKSPFVVLAGEAAIQRSGWTLPVALIDVANPTEAAGDGGLAVRTAENLTLSWRGLRDGPIRLRAPWVALGPGVIVITDPQASNRYAHQRFLLWKDADSKFRSEMDLQYTDSFSVTYACAASGNELVLAQADIEGRFDRPVDVKGTPFPIHTLKSLVLLTYTDGQQFAFVYDDNILVDSLDPQVKWPVEPGHLISLAIHNALFTITPVNSLLLFAELLDEETVQQASLWLGMGLFGLLPTLPDPYAANVSWLRRSNRDGQRMARPSMLLVALVAWTKAPKDEDPDDVTISFYFAPLGTQQDTIAVWTNAAKQQQELSSATLETAGQTFPQETAFQASFSRRGSNQGDWDRFFKVFDYEQFALLDVSTNADQMGVSFAWFNDAALTERDLTFYRIYKPVGNDQQPAFPLEVQQLDLSAQSRYVRAFTLPQVSWEPLFNLSQKTLAGDPPFGWNLYSNDGGPTRLFNDSVKLVPIAPIPVTEFLVQDFDERKNGFTGALFTLPFGLRAFAEFSRTNQFNPALAPAQLGLFKPEYEGGGVKGALQVRADAPVHPVKSPLFAGGTLQLNNVLDPFGVPTFAGTLGDSVGTIFNKEFFYDPPVAFKPSGVPLSRIDFCGYGANIFSHWEDPSAAIAATSKSYFDVFSGRTAQEVIQVRSLIYPWGIHVVRTITMTRASDGYVFRFDTGWQAESDGIYDFRYNVFDSGFNPLPRPNPYVFHPGLVKGVFKVKNIQETSVVPRFQQIWNKKIGDTYLDSEGIEHSVDSFTPPDVRNPAVILQPVYFDADVQIDYVISGAVRGRVPSKGMLGYVQLAPRGEPIPDFLFVQLLASQFVGLGGQIAAVLDVGKSGQQIRISRVDVNASTDASGPIFVSAARGAVVLPKDGSWSVVQHNQGTGEVSPLDPQATVPVIRRGKLSPDATSTDTTPADLVRIANPLDLVQAPGPNTRNFGLLQSTNTQKALFRLPSFQEGVQELKSATPDFADAYRLVNTKAIFPNIRDALSLNLGAFQTKILAEGYKLLDPANPAKVFEETLPDGPLYLINEQFFKLYVEYSNKDRDGKLIGPGVLRYGFDSAANSLGNQWLSKVNDIAMVVDLGSITRLMMIKGKFDTEKGSDPSFKEPQLIFSKELQPVVDILQILDQLQGGDYKAAFEKGLEIAMSNSADSWNYAFHARKEIPAVRFPPGIAYDNPSNPLKLEAHLAVGVYFNEAMSIPNAPSQLIPSAGAFLEFGGSLSVMCVSLAVATVYAVGSVDLRTAADIKTGPSLHMKFGFGAEIAVGLPVIGTVSLLYMVGVQVDLDTSQITVAAFLLFRGRAEILDGIVTVQIQIEAQGIYHRIGSETDLAAQVTFGLDISIFLVINLHFSKSWQETRQIA